MSCFITLFLCALHVIFVLRLTPTIRFLQLGILYHLPVSTSQQMTVGNIKELASVTVIATEIVWSFHIFVKIVSGVLRLQNDSLLGTSEHFTVSLDV